MLPPRTNLHFLQVEPRKDPCIGLIVRLVMHYLDDDWHLQIFHGRDNLEFIKSELVWRCDDADEFCRRDESVLSRVTFTSLVAKADTA